MRWPSLMTRTIFSFLAISFIIILFILSFSSASHSLFICLFYLLTLHSCGTRSQANNLVICVSLQHLRTRMEIQWKCIPSNVFERIVNLCSYTRNNTTKQPCTHARIKYVVCTYNKMWELIISHRRTDQQWSVEHLVLSTRCLFFFFIFVRILA